MSAEPCVLLEFEVDGKAMEIVGQGDRRFLVFDGIAGWNDDPSGLFFMFPCEDIIREPGRAPRYVFASGTERAKASEVFEATRGVA